ncbi:MAG: hypothetical protein IKU01_05415 [Bacteroidales bacterium]|nr:hypothetical protein [Bacteroidales bacterium]
MIQDLIANIYELWGGAYFDGFSNDMYDINAYLPIFLWMIISIVIVSATYYYIINSPRLNRWYWWGAFNLGTSLLNFAIGWGVSYGKLFDLYYNQNMDLPYSGMTEFFPFATICFGWTFVLFFVFSMVIKWGSKNCKHSPIL